MTGLRRLVVLGTSLALAAGSASAKDRGDPKQGAAASTAPVASQVVVRRQGSLVDALRLIVQRTKGLGPTSGVTLVVDPTTAVKEAKAKLADGLAALSSLPDRPKVWQVGPLGGSLSAPVDDPAALASPLDAALVRRVAKVKGATDTISMLRRTLKHAAGAGGLVIYLAHARFEDDFGLEDLIGELRADHRSLAVIGPEAAFERCWSDVMVGFDNRLSDGARLGAPIPGVGNSPFGEPDPARPWHGGDTAYPLGPYHFALATDWDTTFRAKTPPLSGTDVKVEDILRRLAREITAAVPSGFGPYGLMRAAGATDGCYVLWGWTAGVGAPLRYDYAKCDLFPPDLRSRAEILADIVRRPLAGALLEAWSLLADLEPVLVWHSPPLRGITPSEMTYKHGLSTLGIFETPKDRDWRVAEAQTGIALLDRVRTLVEAAVEKVGDPKDDVDRRYRADAHLLLQACEASRFHLNEYVLWSQSLGKDAWKVRRSKSPYVERERWIEGADDDPEVVVREVVVKDTVAAAALLGSRQAFLARYRGTPHGAIVSRNDVYTYKIDVIDLTPSGPVDLPKTGKGSSTGPSGPAPPPPGSGSAGGSGPTTGGK